MRHFYVKGKLTYTTTVEPWMDEQWSTEVFNFSSSDPTEEEKQITRLLDRMLYGVVFGRAGLSEIVERANNQPNKLIVGRQANEGEHSLNAWQGTAIDGIFKNVVLKHLEDGKLKPYRNKLTVVENGEWGPDIYMTSPKTAWDVTTRGRAWPHVERDVFQRGWLRYFLLIWDEPRTASTTLVRAIEQSDRAFGGNKR